MKEQKAIHPEPLQDEQLMSVSGGLTAEERAQQNEKLQKAFLNTDLNFVTSQMTRKLDKSELTDTATGTVRAIGDIPKTITSNK